MPLFNREFANLLGCLVFLFPFPSQLGGEGTRCFCLRPCGCCQMNGFSGRSVRMTGLNYASEHAAVASRLFPAPAPSQTQLHQMFS